MLRYAIAVVSVVATINAGHACTAVDIVAADKTVIAGRTMEWAFDMKWTLVSQPKGTELALTAPADLGLPPSRWRRSIRSSASAPGSSPAGRCSRARTRKGSG